MIDTSQKGKWDEERYQAFRSAPEGPRRRRLLNELLIINEPLVKLLVDQLCGRGEGSRKRGFRAMGGCHGFREIPFEDGMQAGRIAMAKALESFDPSKGRISGWLKMKLRHELQRIVFYGGDLVRVPRGTGVERVPVALVGEEQTIDLLSGGAEDEAIARFEGEVDSIGGALVLSGAEVDASTVANDVTPAVVSPPEPKDGFARFLVTRAIFHVHARVDAWTAHNAYRIVCRRAGESELSQRRFVEQLVDEHPVRPIKVWVPGRGSDRGLSGIRLVQERQARHG